MAATEAARRTRTNRVTDRRGAHTPAQTRNETSASHALPVTPTFHITPNVVIAARGTVRSAHRETSTSHARPVTPAFHITPNVVIAARGTVRSAPRERRSSSLRSLRRFAA